MKRINEPITVRELSDVLDYRGVDPREEDDLYEPTLFVWRGKQYNILLVHAVWHENEQEWLSTRDEKVHVNESWTYRVVVPREGTFDLHRNHKGEWTLVWEHDQWKDS